MLRIVSNQDTRPSLLINHLSVLSGLLSWCCTDTTLRLYSLAMSANLLSRSSLDSALPTKLVIKTNEEAMDRVENGDHVLTKDGILVRVPMRGRDLAVVGGIDLDRIVVMYYLTHLFLPFNVITRSVCSSTSWLSMDSLFPSQFFESFAYA